MTKPKTAKFNPDTVKVPTGKVLVKLSTNHIENKSDGIYLPQKANYIDEGIVIAIGKTAQGDSTYYDYDYKVRRSINVAVGDIVTLSFVTKFTQFTIGKDQYLCVNPSVLTAKCSKVEYYPDL